MTDIDYSPWNDFYKKHVSGQQGKALTEGYLEYIKYVSRKNIPPIFESTQLANLIGIEYDIFASILHAPHEFYRTFNIRKRNGGQRTIQVPRPILMRIQKWILQNILNKVPVHHSAHGFIRDKSIITNATVHCGCTELIKTDLENFFPSIKYDTVINIFKEIGYPYNVSHALTRLCSLSSGLPQGAPTSPYLSNIAAKPLDHEMEQYAHSHSLNYSRYADDITLSGLTLPEDIHARVEKIIINNEFKQNLNKTYVCKKNTRKIVTGISISNNKLILPRKYIRELKKEIFYITKYGIMNHMKNTDRLDPLYIDRIIGKVNFWLQVMPDNHTARKSHHKLNEYIKSL